MLTGRCVSGVSDALLECPVGAAEVGDLLELAVDHHPQRRAVLYQ
jgi:hypothetical protein